jgi:hypothetical protein
MEIDKKEIAVVETEVKTVYDLALQVTISDEESLKQAIDVLSRIKKAGKMVESREEAIKRPLLDSISSLRDLFKPMTTKFKDAETLIKNKILAYNMKIEAEAAKEKARIEARVEKGTMKAETAATKMATINEPQKSVSGSVGKIQTRIVRKVEIVDETLIPREYLIPDRPRITDAVLKQNINVPGTQIIEEKQLAAS